MTPAFTVKVDGVIFFMVKGKLGRVPEHVSGCDSSFISKISNFSGVYLYFLKQVEI